MNAASIIVIAVVLGFAALAVVRALRKGAPCSCGCGGDGKPCACAKTGAAECHCHDRA